MVLLTLIGEHQAHVGKHFFFLGPLSECKECKRKQVCFNLESGCNYEIVAVRAPKHDDCIMHEGSVRVVEVEKRPITSVVKLKSAIEGSTITIDELKCNNLGCESYTYCHPYGLKVGTKMKIVKIEGDMTCPEGEKLVKASLI